MTKLLWQRNAVFGVLCLLVCSSLAQAPPSLEERYRGAQNALATGNYREAQQRFEDLVATNPEVAEVHANLGLIYFEEKKFWQAVSELRRALQLRPSLSRSEFLLGMSLSELGHYKEALPGLQKGFRSEDREMKRMCGLQLERAYTGLGQDPKAVEIALEMNRLFPDDPEVLYHNGRIFGNFAFLSMQKLPQIAPTSVWTHQAAAEAYESQADYGSAITEYRQVLTIDPQRPGVHYRLGRTLLARSRETSSAEDREAAIKEFERELKLDPLNASAAYEIGEVHRNAGEFDDAEVFFGMALKNYPNFEEAHLGLAAVLMHVGKPGAALTHLQQAISINPSNDVSWYRLSQAERSLGHATEAQKAIAKFKELHSKIPEAAPGKPLFTSTDEVTKQTVDANASQ